MTKYLLKSSPKNEQKQDSDLSSNEIAFQNLIHEINDDLVVHKKVFRMTQLLDKYKAYLPTDTGTYSSAKLQDRHQSYLLICQVTRQTPVPTHLPSYKTG